MPEISTLGWLHTIVGILALLSGAFTLTKYKVISMDTRSGMLYLVCTFIAASSALAIFRHGSFNAAHALAILTLLALLVGTVCAKTRILGAFSPYMQAISYSATLLFHMIPAITDGLMRLPVDDPIVKDIEDPLLKQFYLAFLICYLVGVTLQVIWLKRGGAVAAAPAPQA